MIWIVLVLFVLGALIDIAWARYILATGGHRPMAAALWAIAIYLPYGVFTAPLAHHPWLVLPLAVGAGVGTLVTVWRARTLARRGTLVGSPSAGGARASDT